VSCLGGGVRQQEAVAGGGGFVWCLGFCMLYRRRRVTSWPGLNRINRILISTSCNFFSGSSSEKNSRLSVLGLEQYDDG
jgi:hypothetical protein